MNEELHSKRVRIRAYGSGPNDLARVSIAANADGHSILAPTHLVERDGEVVGAIEIGSTPTVLVWMDSKKAGARDSLSVMDFFENWVSALNAKNLILPCSAKSPYLPYLGKMGYVDVGQFNLFIKKV